MSSTAKSTDTKQYNCIIIWYNICTQGIMATSTDENAITSLISSDEPQVTDADGDDNPAPSDPEPTKSAINDKLRRSIETRRKKSGLAEIKVEWKESEPEMVRYDIVCASSRQKYLFKITYVFTVIGYSVRTDNINLLLSRN